VVIPLLRVLLVPNIFTLVVALSDHDIRTPFATFVQSSELQFSAALYLTPTLRLSHIFAPNLHRFSGLPMPFSSIVP